MSEGPQPGTGPGAGEIGHVPAPGRLTELFRQTLPCARVEAAAFLPRAWALAFAGWTEEGGERVFGDLLLWDLGLGRVDSKVRQTRRRCLTRLIAASPDGRSIAYGGWCDMPACLHLWSVEPPGEVWQEEIIPPPVEALAFSDQGLLAVGLPDAIELRDGRRLEARSPCGPEAWRDAHPRLLAMAFSPGGGWLLASRFDDGERPGAMHGDPPEPGRGMIPGLPDDLAVNVAHRLDAVREPSRSALCLVRATDLDGPPRVTLLEEPARRVLFLDGERALLGLESGAVGCFSVSAGRVATTRPSHRSRVSAMALDRAGRRLATGAEDGSILLWDPERLLVLGAARRDAGVLALAFDPSGLLMSAGSDGVIRAWAARA